MPPKNSSAPSISPRRKSLPEPPKVMTWGRASLVLAVALVFDLLRAFFSFFWFFGPALLGAYCAIQVGDVAVIGGLLAGACVAGATAAGIVASPATTTFGVIMAMMSGFMGFLVLGLWIILLNPRLFRTAAQAPLWFVGSFATTQIPFVGGIPVFSIVMWRLYSAQIRIEKEKLKKYKELVATDMQRQRQEQILYRTQYLRAQEASNEEISVEQTMDNSSFSPREASNDGSGIPQSYKKVA